MANNIAKPVQNPGETDEAFAARVAAYNASGGGGAGAAAPAVAARVAAEASRKSFADEQKARQVRFERDNSALVKKADRDQADAIAKAEVAEKVRLAEEKNDVDALADGLITDQDIVNRRHLMQANFDSRLSHECLEQGEVTVRMAFVNNVTLLTNDGRKIFFHKGYCDVPVSVADHQYLWDGGARRVDGSGKFEPAEARAARVKAAVDKDAVTQRPGETNEAFAARKAAAAARAKAA